MSYPHTRDGVLAAATSCQAKGVKTLTTSALTNRRDAERAFGEWKAAGGSGVVMTFTMATNGDLMAVFTPEP